MPGGSESPIPPPPDQRGPGSESPGSDNTPQSTAGTPGGEPGQPADGELPGWTDMEPAAGDDGWETSNQVPGNDAGSSRQPGAGESGEQTAGAPGTPGNGSTEDGELDEALKDFDGEILAERDVIRQRANEGAGSGGSSIPMPSQREGGSGETAGVDGPVGSETGADTPGGPMGVPRARSTPPAPAATAGNIPDDIPDARDDDIIARQLREAAMQETDPELKEKLWDEYRRYKGI